MPELDDSYAGAEEALAELKATLEKRAAAPPFRMNVPQAVANVIIVARSLGEDAALFKELFTPKGFDPAAYADLDKRGLALWRADVEYRLALDPEGNLPPLLEKATPLRRSLLAAADYLWGSSADKESQLAAIRAGRGHMDIGDDLLALSALLSAEAEYVTANTKLTEVDLKEAARVAQSLIRTLTARDSDTAVTNARALRDRAGDYAVEGVNAVRRAATFTYGEDDAQMDRYPSVYAGRGVGGGRKPEPDGPAG